MTMLEVLVIAMGGFVGAILRAAISSKCKMPFGTLLVNWAGAFGIGIVFGLELSLTWQYFLASGFTGALTTFSTMKKELILLWEEKKIKKMTVYLIATYGGGLLLTAIGYAIGTVI
ncbi:CrcB family protein [Sporosarcina sp. HYO08]|uniref:fluoride efflux transporter FluC n=1 Tax=Sporosarcina sp. HYO08 TaxID=1759557 RepID=UPI0007911EF2|nr:CrcB family protein [Sporosarcina sp. HYO08]KXH86891.1 hypothetical protein AU377_13745 [Sporosarcina sp. HYO08]